MQLRSERWLSGTDEVAMSHRVALAVTRADAGKPVIGIADTTSKLNPCNAVFSDLITFVESGIRDAGGIPARFPVTSLGEDLMKPSAMLYRNMVAMELEENVRANPLDGVVYFANCDKSVPAAIMAAASTDLPSLLLLGGSRLAPTFRGRPLGAGTDLWRALDDRRAGRLDDSGWDELESTLSCAGGGSCNTMGTASTMAVVSELLGLSLPGSAGLLAVGPEIKVIAYESGVRAVGAVINQIKPSSVVSQAAVDNAITALAAIGGSTNAVIHLAAIAGRLGLDASLRRMDHIWRQVPLLVDVEPCGTQLISAFVEAGGVPTLVAALGDLIDASVQTAEGRPWSVHSQASLSTRTAGVIRTRSEPLAPPPVLAAVFGSLAPDGAIIKVAAASPHLLTHRGPAVVFEDYEQMREALDNDGHDYSPDDVLIVRQCGPRGVPGMPEWGMAPIPQRLLEAGVRDMVRVTDGRMSGTSFGTVVLHVAPESAAGGPLGIVETGDQIVLDIAKRLLSIDVDDETLNARRQAKVPALASHLRGWPLLYQNHVQQAPLGCDLDFLVGDSSEARGFVEPVVGRS